MIREIRGKKLMKTCANCMYWLPPRGLCQEDGHSITQATHYCSAWEPQRPESLRAERAEGGSQRSEVRDQRSENDLAVGDPVGWIVTAILILSAAVVLVLVF